MKNDYHSILADPNDSMAQLTKGIPDVMEGYKAMSSAAKAGGCFDTKTKELIATAIGVAVRCDSCIASHTKAASVNGATQKRCWRHWVLPFLWEEGHQSYMLHMHS